MHGTESLPVPILLSRSQRVSMEVTSEIHAYQSLESGAYFAKEKEGVLCDGQYLH
jgi:hypothetical protein